MNKQMKALDVTKYCHKAGSEYVIDASELEHAMGWSMGQLPPRIELCDGQGWSATVRFTNSVFDDEDGGGWRFRSPEGDVTLMVLND